MPVYVKFISFVLHVSQETVHRKTWPKTRDLLNARAWKNDVKENKQIKESSTGEIKSEM
jgi:hypothetical protein